MYNYTTQYSCESSHQPTALNTAISHCPMRAGSVGKQYVTNKITSSYNVIVFEKSKKVFDICL